jgi:cytoskeletal protein CcmA (bactofilin family)
MEISKQSVKQTLVEEGTELKGTLKATCQVVVNGTIDGQIEAPELTINQSGAVLGIVKVQKLRSEGTLAGSIDAEDVYLSGTVRSNTMIRASKLEVKLTQERGKLEVTFGECLLDVGEDPAQVAQRDPEKQPAIAVVPATTLAERIPEAADSDGDGGGNSSPPGDPDGEGALKDGGGRRSNKKNSDRRDSQIPST